MKPNLLTTCVVTLALCASSLANDMAEQKDMTLDKQLQQSVASQNDPTQTVSLYQDDRTILQKLMERKPDERDGRFYNSRVDLAPKSWPYPMVVNTRRPVLPGSAW